MNRKAKSVATASYPNLWRWVAEFGTLEIGHCHQTRSFIRVLDEGGMIWKGRRNYPSVDAALEDADARVSIQTLYKLEPQFDRNG